jgi:cell division protein ZapA
MSDVTLSIGGRQYRVACADGQEAHIAGLGATIEQKLATMGGNASQNEARALLYAALLLADELFELKQAPADTGSDPAPGLEALAARLEILAARLER